MQREHQTHIRVRYHETDGQGRVHHSQYLLYFEHGRVEFLRAVGHSYRELEKTGLMLVVSHFDIKYLLPAEFDDELILTTRVLKSRGARIEHSYHLHRGEELLVQAHSKIACIDRQGNVKRLPDFLQMKED